MSYKTISLLVIALLLLGLGYVTEKWLDMSVSYGYTSAEEKDLLAENKRFRRMLLTALSGQEKGRLVSLLNEDARAHPEEHSVIKDEGRLVFYDDQDFRFSEKGLLEGIGRGVGVPSPSACGGPEAPKNAPCLAP
ncbi:immunity protein 58 [Bacillus sp. NP157]|nr:immunity protein 58 [Bacillus sp. NP157]